jgi:hypothetical protein
VSRQLLAPAAIAALALIAGGCAAAPQGALPRHHQHWDASGQETVTGKLEMEGGPVNPGKPQPGIRPIPGVVRFTRGGRRAASVRVGRSGRFSLHLAPGIYDAVGRSPKIVEVSDGAVIGAKGHVISGSQHETACSQPVRVVVTPRHTVSVVVACIVP